MKQTIRFMAVSALAFSVACVMGLSQAQAADYVGPSQCKICHNKKDTGAQYDKWKESKHSSAFEALKSPKALEIAKEKGLEKPPSESPQCVKCHVTAFDMAAKEVSADAVPAKIKLEDSVSCEECHGPGSDHIAAGKKVMFQKDTSIDMAATQQKVTAEKCTQCHNEESPTWNPEQYTLDDGSKVGFDFDQAYKKIAHPDPKLAKDG